MRHTDYTREAVPKAIYRARRFQEFPEWARALPLVPEGLEKKASAAFAWSDRRLLPIHDRHATFLSALDMFEHLDEYPEQVVERVKKAVEIHELRDDLAPYAEHLAETHEKQAAAPESSYALVIEKDDDQITLFPTDDPDRLRSSLSELCKMAGERRIPYLRFVEASRNLVKRAQELDVTDEVPASVMHAGIDRQPDPNKASWLLEKRASEVAEGGEEYRDLAGEVEEGLDPWEALGKMASIDQRLGVRYRYTATGAHRMPHAVIFCGPPTELMTKAAAETVFTEHSAIPLQAFRDIPENVLLARLGREAGETVLDVRGDGPSMTAAMEKLAGDRRRELLKMVVEYGR